MPATISLLTSLETLEQLHRLADSKRVTVTVTRDTLAQLLTDHGAMARALSQSGVKVREPAPKRARLNLNT